ncbi:MAG: hypothetical protein KJ990_11640 [Proteobacteria bacterium]|nr:hypothetical protein [Pseudomonadota bacterium]MBU1647908.1 hypothetical protein [Pseudomonadota bacterium]
MTSGKKKLTLTSAALLGLACTFGFAGTIEAQEAGSSSECIKCHTDLDQMDSFGALAASSSAGIAG